jgi:hypothetical protein
VKLSTLHIALAVLCTVLVGAHGAIFVVTGHWWHAVLACWWTGIALFQGKVARLYEELER